MVVSRATESSSPDHQYYAEILDVQQKGVMTGYGDGRFGPDDTLKRAELATLLVRARVSDQESAACTDLSVPDLEVVVVHDGSTEVG